MGTLRIRSTMKRLLLLKLCIIAGLCNISSAEMSENALRTTNATEATRDKRQFSLFTIVTFPNDQCTASSGSSTGASKGTCLSSTECNSKSGTVDGNCASGFGVCCVFKISSCSGTVTENCTYIQNPGYTSSYTTSGSCSFSVTPLNSDICQMRLDFDTFTTTIATDGVCTDSFIVTSPGTANSLPTLCGTLKNQHLYFEQARSSSTATLAFTISTTTTGATFSIKVSQIECSSLSKAPTDCNMYHTGIGGYIQSYNWQGNNQIHGSKWSTCIRREDGYCQIAYRAKGGETIDTFQLDDSATTALANGGWAALVEGYVIIAGGVNSASVSGEKFASGDAVTQDSVIIGTGPRFIVSRVVSTTVHANPSGDSGYYLQYDQIACGNYNYN